MKPTAADYGTRNPMTLRAPTVNLLPVTAEVASSSPVVNGQAPPAQEDPSRAKYKTKAEVVAFVKRSFADGAAAIKAKGDAGMTGPLVDPFENEQVRAYDWAYGFIEHCGEHYGQLAVYYRVAGLVPPESRPKPKT